MTNPTLERAARALALSYLKADYEHEDALGRVENDWRDWLPEVRAVLMAVREPDLNVVGAMFDRLDNGVLGEDFDTTDVWQAGLAAILAEGE